MKKLMVLVMVIAMLFCGCAGLKQSITGFLCTPTDAQKTAANVGLALVQAALVAAGTFSGNPVIASLATEVKPVFDTVVSGVCVLQADWNAAVAKLQTASAQPVAAKAMADRAGNLDDAFRLLNSQSWPK